jgi:hypothetical protein
MDNDKFYLVMVEEEAEELLPMWQQDETMASFYRYSSFVFDPPVAYTTLEDLYRHYSVE